MATYTPPKRATAYRTYVELVSQANTKLFQVNPTLAAGDVQVSKDGGAFANLTTLPSVAPAAGRSVQVDLSATEMTADNVVVQFVDAAGAEWCDLAFTLQTAARQIDDLAFPATSGRSVVVDAAGLVDANTVKVGPSGSGTAQTAGDIPARLPAALTGGGNIKADALAWNGLTTVALPLIPTVAGRTLDVSAGGEAGLDWANVGSPTTAVDLSGTTIKTTQKVDVDTIKTNPVVNGGTITFPTTATLASTTNITAGTIATVSGNVNGSVATVTDITTTAQAELAAPPASNAAPLTKLNWLFLLAKNKITQTSTTQLVRNDADSSTVGTSTVSDDGTTAIRGKFS